MANLFDKAKEEFEKLKKEQERRVLAAQEEANKLLANPLIPKKAKEAMIRKIQQDLQEGKGPSGPAASSLA